MKQMTDAATMYSSAEISSELGSAGNGRIVVVGKGGVGKSTITALLSRLLAGRGLDVLAVDADEQMNLAATLGLDLAAILHLTPLAASQDYISEKTGALAGEPGGMLRLNPDVRDVVERVAFPAFPNLHLLVMGGVASAGSGCLCPETSLLSATVRTMGLLESSIVLMDTHAGLEHFGRSLARGFDQALVVVEPSYNAVDVGLRSALLAHELGINSLHLVVNRVRSDADLSRVNSYLEAGPAGITFTSKCALPYDELALSAEPSVEGLLEGSPLALAATELIKAVLSDPSKTVLEAR